MKLKISLISALLLTLSSYAFGQLVDKTIVIVNNEVITQNQFLKEYEVIRESFALRGKRLPDSPEIRQQVLDKLILTSIILQKAKETRVNISEQKINAAIAQVARNNKMNVSQFRRAMNGQGKDFSEFKNDVKQELTIQETQNKEINKRAVVTDQEILDAINQSGENDNIEYLTAHILLPVPDAATPQVVNEQREKISSLLVQLNQGADFKELAQQHSSGQLALEGGSLGWRKKHAIPSIFVDPVQQLDINEYSQPIRSPSGFHILHLIDKRSANQVIVNQTRARHILIKPDAIQSDEDVVDKLISLRDRIIQGDDFAILARANSVDHVSASKGGDLGWLTKGDTVPQFQDTMDSMQGDEISQPFQSQFGWHILQVTGKRTIDDTESAQRSKIRQQLLSRKKQEALELWHKQLRDDAYIKVL